jgi:pimeloyl-ACP methyl ester carboxylesterase
MRMSGARLRGAVGRIAIVSLLWCGCLYSRAAEVPMPMQMHSGDSPKGVFVFLPGLGDRPEKFVEHGFVEKVKALGYDAVTVDAHFGYYRERSLRPRLEADVIANLRQKYREIWLVGISLGGFGSVIYSKEHPDIAGLIMLAPFLGDDDVWGPIEQAGGLAKWDPGDTSKIEDEDQRTLTEMWAWLKGYASKEQRPQLYLGYGKEDRFARPGSILSAALPSDHVAVVPGGHKWTSWDLAFAKLMSTFSGADTRSSSETHDRGE